METTTLYSQLVIARERHGDAQTRAHPSDRVLEAAEQLHAAAARALEATRHSGHEIGGTMPSRPEWRGHWLPAEYALGPLEQIAALTAAWVATARSRRHAERAGFEAAPWAEVERLQEALAALQPPLQEALVVTFQRSTCEPED